MIMHAVITWLQETKFAPRRKNGSIQGMLSDVEVLCPRAKQHYRRINIFVLTCHTRNFPCSSLGDTRSYHLTCSLSSLAPISFPWSWHKKIKLKNVAFVIGFDNFMKISLLGCHSKEMLFIFHFLSRWRSAVRINVNLLQEKVFAQLPSLEIAVLDETGGPPLKFKICFFNSKLYRIFLSLDENCEDKSIISLEKPPHFVSLLSFIPLYVHMYTCSITNIVALNSLHVHV